ncbi:SDR family NAD(P)-dependent oxidoreductase [uncultured Zhongshania sp.]|jgi:short-subunit dehydrogenase|uniref:SDR family NAD(P)-dependent oxidoreductase n=1 Tax=uncultured Zhongshania sp. TaxID=1642288 RepID=UPI0025D87824|nr:SDR family NAD(P)-dependent oxidoreductase [uncultured Zhongshania sp.]
MLIDGQQVAVITGAASGIGLGLVNICAARNIRIVAADISQARLESLSKDLQGRKIDHQIMVCDVSDPSQIKALADLAYSHYGQVNLLFNNAGIMINGLSWECGIAEWQKTININLMGAVYGIHEFVPRMLMQASPAHIVNTSSLAGLLSSPMMAPYSASKHALVSLSESVLYDLQSQGSEIGVSVLCPAQVDSNIMDAIDIGGAQHGTAKQLNDFLRSGIQAGMSADDVAEQVFDAIERGAFWIFTHPDFKPAYLAKADALANERNPIFEQVICD